MNPESNLTTSTTIVWSYANSTDPDNHAISNVEWKLDNVVVDVMPSKLSLGIHKVDLRVQDEKGLWSDTVSQEITINETTFLTGTFTNAGAIGRYGPTKDQLDNAYLMTDLEGKVYLEQIGIQLWEVPQSGRYKLEVYGSQGGSNAVTAGGKGAIISGEFILNKHDVLKILVGQTGDAGASYDNYASGAPTRAGGGGTFIWQSTSTTPLIVAGGGGGAGSVIFGGDALSTQGTKKTSGYYAAGWSYNGVAGYNTSIALSPLNGGTGGRQDSDSTLFQTHGGFGGGTGSAGSSVYEFGGGGGGGYHGGAGLRGSKLNGLGGSSYNTGINQSNTVGNTGHGKAIITYLGQ
jgi:tripartite motif-containing protein 56